MFQFQKYYCFTFKISVFMSSSYAPAITVYTGDSSKRHFTTACMNWTLKDFTGTLHRPLVSYFAAKNASHTKRCNSHYSLNTHDHAHVDNGHCSSLSQNPYNNICRSSDHQNKCHCTLASVQFWLYLCPLSTVTSSPLCIDELPAVNTIAAQNYVWALASLTSNLHSATVNSIKGLNPNQYRDLHLVKILLLDFTSGTC